jgi:hypothetical protein
VAASLDDNSEHGSVLASELPPEPDDPPEPDVVALPAAEELPPDAPLPAVVVKVGIPLPPVELLHAATLTNARARLARTTRRFTNIPCSPVHVDRSDQARVP